MTLFQHKLSFGWIFDANSILKKIRHDSIFFDSNSILDEFWPELYFVRISDTNLLLKLNSMSFRHRVRLLLIRAIFWVHFRHEINFEWIFETNLLLDQFSTPTLFLDEFSTRTKLWLYFQHELSFVWISDTKKFLDKELVSQRMKFCVNFWTQWDFKCVFDTNIIQCIFDTNLILRAFLTGIRSFELIFGTNELSSELWYD